MSNVDIARALKDKEYFNSLTEEQKSEVRATNPAGSADLQDDALESVSGGIGGGVGQPLQTGSGSVVVAPLGKGGVAVPLVCNCNC